MSRVRGGRKMNGEEEEEEDRLIIPLNLPRWRMSNSGIKLEEKNSLFHHVILSSGRVVFVLECLDNKGCRNSR